MKSPISRLLRAILGHDRGGHAATTLPSLCLFLVACDPAGNKTAEDPEASEVEVTISTTWPITRGGPSLSGRVPGPSPTAPEIAWTFSLESPGAAEAAATDEVIVVGDVMGYLYAISIETRDLLWKFETADTIEAAPAIHEDRVYFGSSDGSFHSLDLKSGNEVWKISGDEKFSSAANLIPGPDGSAVIVVNGYDGTTRCLDPSDGSVLWTYATEDYINGTPALVDGKLAFGGCDTVLHVLDSATGVKRNAIATDSQITDSIATSGNTLYAANYANQVVAADADASEPVWIYQSDDLPFFSAPAVDDEHVYIGCRDKSLHAIKRTDGTGAWTFPTGGPIESSPIVFDDAVVFGSGDGRLYALETSSGEEIWRLDLGEKLTAAPIFSSGHLIIAGGDGTLFVVR